MRYTDFQKLRTGYHAEIEQGYEKLRPIQAADHEAVETVSRRWLIGNLNETSYDSARELWATFDGTCSRLDSGYHAHEQRTPSKVWYAFAEVVEVIERWKAGEIDELPPNGVWSDVRASLPKSSIPPAIIKLK